MRGGWSGCGLRRRCASIRPLDPAAMAAARDLQARLTKPAGSLGRLEELAERLGRARRALPTAHSRPYRGCDLRR